MKKAITFLAPIALLALGACATPFKADVSRFQELPAPQGQSFVIRAADPADAGGIEFSQYASLIAGEMIELGYVQAQGSNADMTVSLDYGVDEGKTEYTGDPFYGSRGGPRFGDVGINLDAVPDRLESLRRWGNLTVSSSIGNPSSLADYYRRRSRYLS